MSSSAGRAASMLVGASSLNGTGPSPSAALGRESLKPVQTEEIAITLGVGQAHLLNVGVVRRAAVGNGRILQVNALDNRQLLLLPESVGESSLHLWLGHGEIRKYRIHVTAQNQHRQVEEINALLGPDSGVIARLAGNRVVLEGERPTEEGSYRVGEVLKRYPDVVSLVSRTGFERMVNLEVKMIEVSRNALKQLGVRWHSGAGAWSMAGPSFGVIGDFKRSTALMPGEAGEAAAQAAGLSVLPRVSPFATSVAMVSSLRSMIDLMVQNGDAAVLAEPRLSTRSGGNARFVAGGELPLPVLGGNGSASVQFKEYGVRFDVSPTVNARGIISASLHTEISSINEDVVVQGMPGLRKQSASTDVNLRPGQTLVIAGMVSQEMTGAVEKIPGLGDLPILGHLFRSKRFRNRESEMIVLITPQLAGEQDETADPRLAPIESRFQQIRERVGMLD
ncbi:MAG: pilus assembly protein N-terminal domain-containing protein [Lautropia sp.]|nr:pilus assembly protein N-terminal domain-containing protein [Lautropia sp.]